MPVARTRRRARLWKSPVSKPRCSRIGRLSLFHRLGRGGEVERKCVTHSRKAGTLKNCPSQHLVTQRSNRVSTGTSHLSSRARSPYRPKRPPVLSHLDLVRQSRRRGFRRSAPAQQWVPTDRLGNATPAVLSVALTDRAVPMDVLSSDTMSWSMHSEANTRVVRLDGFHAAASCSPSASSSLPPLPPPSLLITIAVSEDSDPPRPST